MGFTQHGDREIDGVLAYPTTTVRAKPRVVFVRGLEGEASMTAADLAPWAALLQSCVDTTWACDDTVDLNWIVASSSLSSRFAASS